MVVKKVSLEPTSMVKQLILMSLEEAVTPLQTILLQKQLVKAKQQAHLHLTAQTKPEHGQSAHKTKHFLWCGRLTNTQ